MKKIGLGIAMILFGILLALSMGGVAYLSWVIGVMGLAFAIAGFLIKEET